MNTLLNWQDIVFGLLRFLQQRGVGLIVAVGLIILVGRAVVEVANRYISRAEKQHAVRKWTRYITAAFVIVWVLLVYSSHVQKETPFFLFLVGILLAGVAISMRDVFSNVVGWLIIMSSRGYKTGDRIKIGETSGDVIDIGLLRTMVAEIGDWVGADQSTGRLVSIPNSKILTQEVLNYTKGYDLIWHELKILVTFESDWQHAEQIISDVAMEDFNRKKEQIQERLKRVKRDYLLRFNYITPKVYVSIRESGVELALRYMVRARRRRTVEDVISREILRRFAREQTVDFAYPTMRIHRLDAETART